MEHWKTRPEQLKLFELEAALSILALHRYTCPEVPLEFLHPRLFNPNQPIPDMHDDSFDTLATVHDFPETPPFPQVA